MKNVGKKEQLTPKLRFPEFRDEPEWDESVLNTLPFRGQTRPL